MAIFNIELQNCIGQSRLINNDINSPLF